MFLDKVLAFLHGPDLAIYLGVALGVSEALALVPALKSNSLIQLVVNSLKWIKDKLLASPSA